MLPLLSPLLLQLQVQVQVQEKVNVKDQEQAQLLRPGRRLSRQPWW
jgi:hypothetical protein